MVESARPGDVIDVADGRYRTGITIPKGVRGTPGNPIVLRSRTKAGAVFSDCGGQTLNGGTPCMYVQGSWIVIQDFLFTGTADGVIELEGEHNRVFRNGFENTGSGDNGGCCALITSPHDWRNKQWNDPNPTRLLRSNRIDENVFRSVRNTVYGQGHGVIGTTFSHNVIDGPPGIEGDWETEAIKIGGDFANEPTDTVIQFNTIKGWRGSPYTIGIKGSAVTISYNVIDSGDIYLRIADNNTVVGNVLGDGSIIAAGTNHRLLDNYVRSVTAPASFGPLTAMTNQSVSNSFGNFDGVNLPFYVARFRDSLAEGNTFVTTGPSQAVVTVVVASSPGPTGVRFVSNSFVRTSAGPILSGRVDLVTPNVFSLNLFFCAPPCTSDGLPSGSGNSLSSTVSPGHLLLPTTVRLRSEFVRASM